MKQKIIVRSLLALALIGALAGCATEREQESKLESQAKVSRAAAEQTALAKVPGGAIKEGELEKEKGTLIWSFDISKPGTTDIAEVQVNAITGEVVSVENESAEKEAKEKK